MQQPVVKRRRLFQPPRPSHNSNADPAKATAPGIAGLSIGTLACGTTTHAAKLQTPAPSSTAPVSAPSGTDSGWSAPALSSQLLLFSPSPAKPTDHHPTATSRPHSFSRSLTAAPPVAAASKPFGPTAKDAAGGAPHKLDCLPVPFDDHPDHDSETFPATQRGTLERFLASHSSLHEAQAGPAPTFRLCAVRKLQSMLLPQKLPPEEGLPALVPAPSSMLCSRLAPASSARHRLPGCSTVAWSAISQGLRTAPSHARSRQGLMQQVQQPTLKPLAPPAGGAGDSTSHSTEEMQDLEFEAIMLDLGKQRSEITSGWHPCLGPAWSDSTDLCFSSSSDDDDDDGAAAAW